MPAVTIDAVLFKKMFLTGAKRLESKKEIINELNVFPVPDGDTGTNMTMTIMSAVKEVNKLNNPTMAELAKAISSGSLRGARGNSGVILSQLLRGLCKVLGQFEKVDVYALKLAIDKAVETAYKAVMKPKEGTILTVARAASEKASELLTLSDEKDEDLDFIPFCQDVLKAMEVALEKTPELLPVLKEAGVVDSGGTGLIELVHGMKDAFLNPDIEISFESEAAPVRAASPKGAASNDISTADIKFGYCTEFIIMLEKEFLLPQELEFKAFLESIGDSIVCVALDDIVKVHVHTNHPGQAFEKALEYGQLTSMKIDNMREEHNERVITGSLNPDHEAITGEKAEEAPAEEVKEPVKEEKPAPRKDNGFIAVSVGEGLNEIFKGLGVDYIIEGGQTMNPSTEDMLKAIEQVNADNIFILPNNGNIILAATQASHLTEDKNVVVIPSKTVPQGISAMINFFEGKSAEENEEAMTESLSSVKTGQITYAVRDTFLDGKNIHVNDIMGLDDKKIIAVSRSIEETALETIRTMAEDADAELISIYYGEGITEDDANALAEKVSEVFEDIDVEVHFGGQPVYYYIVSVE
ncbi:MAG: DAK2 domain-containing protein [Lachnospiraceae bacterium]|nr:DAK2 domain-containing protein [Lachnospiraceae bacterium]